jgi:hypothetical protein
VSNPGVLPLPDVVITDPVPEKMTFVSATEGGQATDGVVRWSLGPLGPGARKAVQVVLKAKETGEIVNRATATAAGGVTAEAEAKTLFEGGSGLTADVDDRDDPLEVGSQTVSRSQCSTRERCRRSRWLSSPRCRINWRSRAWTARRRRGGRTEGRSRDHGQPRTEVVYKITVVARKPGDVRFRVELSADRRRCRRGCRCGRESTTIYDPNLPNAPPLAELPGALSLARKKSPRLIHCSISRDARLGDEHPSRNQRPASIHDTQAKGGCRRRPVHRPPTEKEAEDGAFQNSAPPAKMIQAQNSDTDTNTTTQRRSPIPSPPSGQAPLRGGYCRPTGVALNRRGLEPDTRRGSGLAVVRPRCLDRLQHGGVALGSQITPEGRRNDRPGLYRPSIRSAVVATSASVRPARTVAYRSLPEVARYQSWETFTIQDGELLLRQQADVHPTSRGRGSSSQSSAQTPGHGRRLWVALPG